MVCCSLGRSVSILQQSCSYSPTSMPGCALFLQCTQSKCLLCKQSPIPTAFSLLLVSPAFKIQVALKQTDRVSFLVCLFLILPLTVSLTVSPLSFFAPVFAHASLAYICKVNSRSSLLHLLCSFSSCQCQDFISVSFCQLHFMKSPLCKDVFPSLSLLVPRKSILIHYCVALKVSHKNRQVVILQLFAGTQQIISLTYAKQPCYNSPFPTEGERRIFCVPNAGVEESKETSNEQ